MLPWYIFWRNNYYACSLPVFIHLHSIPLANLYINFKYNYSHICGILFSRLQTCMYTCSWKPSTTCPLKCWHWINSIKVMAVERCSYMQPPTPPFNQWFRDSFSCPSLNSVDLFYKSLERYIIYTFQMVQSNDHNYNWDIKEFTNSQYHGQGRKMTNYRS